MNKFKKTLSKSNFKLALECPRKLYYYSNRQEYANQKQENDFLEALAEGGFQVGELAKYYYPCCDNMPDCNHEIKSKNYIDAINETSQYLDLDEVTLYEPLIQFEDFLIRIDIFIKNGNSIDLIEVKAKSFNTERGSFKNKKGRGDYIASEWRPYLYDVAFQTWVAQRAFPDCKINPYLMLTDKTAISSVEGLNQLFRIVKNDDGRKDIKVNKKITPEILGDDLLVKIPVQEYVEMIWAGIDMDPLKKKAEDLKPFSNRIQEYADYYVNNKKYPVTTGLKCKKCEFKNSSTESGSILKSGFEECWKSQYGDDYDFNEPHIFELWDFRKSEEVLDRGIHFLKDLKYEDLFKKEPTPSDKGMGRINRQWLQINKRIGRSENLGEHIEDQLYEEMDEWNFPLHFIDFETSMVAIPFTKGRRPYEQTAFQFSCHTLYEDGRIKHSEWLSESLDFPNYQFVLELRKVLGDSYDDGTIFRYSNHENTVLRQIYDQIKKDSEIKLFKNNNLAKEDILNWIDLITNWKAEDIDGKEVRYSGDRDMVDLWKCVKDYYYHPKMAGSNSIKQVLPTVLNVSEFLKEKYSKPLTYGKNLINKMMFQVSNGKIMDPYKLLPPIHDELPTDSLQLETGYIQDGGAAMVAYAKLQFTDMEDYERERIVKALLRYCELDTLAMVMIYEHWNSLKNKNNGQ